jgi:hypothetical protein
MLELPLFIAVLVFSAFLGTVGYMILVNNRLLILTYARQLNFYRSCISQEPLGPLWVDPKKPAFHETQGVMPLLTHALASVNGLYLGIATFGSVLSPLGRWRAGGVAIGAGLLFWCWIGAWYRNEAAAAGP